MLDDSPPYCLIPYRLSMYQILSYLTIPKVR
nr:MAG TPA: hypothetical protein [Caudoviricetes sp.]